MERGLLEDLSHGRELKRGKSLLELEQEQSAQTIGVSTNR
jgi:hypothetical protein